LNSTGYLPPLKENTTKGQHNKATITNNEEERIISPEEHKRKTLTKKIFRSKTLIMRETREGKKHEGVLRVCNSEMNS
jgi:hypothetical protein